MSPCNRLGSGDLTPKTLSLILSGIILFPGFAMKGMAQITTNNALPVGKGKGIIRVQHKIIRATDDPSMAERDLFVQAIPFVGVYGISFRCIARAG